MTSPRSWQTAFRMWRVPAVLAVCLAPALAACSSAAARVQLPARAAAPTTPRPGPPAVLTPRQQVIAALGGYAAALGQAEPSGSVAAARRLLHPYLAANRIGGLVRAMSTIWGSGDAFYGQDFLHVMSVRIKGRRAFVQLVHRALLSPASGRASSG